MSVGTDDIETKLSTALHEVAAQIQVDAHSRRPAEPSRSAAPRAKRPLVVAFAVVAVFVVVGIVALQLYGGESTKVRTAPTRPANNGKETRAGDLLPDEADVVAYMHIQASPQQIDMVRTSLASSPLVKRFAFFDQDASYRVFKKIFSHERDLVQNVDPASLPTSFVVFTRSCADRARLIAQLNAADGVDDVQLAPGLSQSDAREALPRDRTGKRVAPSRCAKD